MKNSDGLVRGPHVGHFPARRLVLQHATGLVSASGTSIAISVAVKSSRKFAEAYSNSTCSPPGVNGMQERNPLIEEADGPMRGAPISLNLNLLFEN